ncbi:MAG: OOP family OmpA-OmpF porin [Sphingobacteriales bacterium]|jgi:OOP family OmpA-OmpF porin
MVLVGMNTFAQKKTWSLLFPDLDGEQIMPIMDPNGENLYLSVVFNDDNNIVNRQDIWSSNEQSNFKTIVHDTTYNNADHNAIIGFTNDKIYLLNLYDGNYRQGVSYTQKTEAGWSEPSPVIFDDIYTQEVPYGFYVHPNDEVMFLSLKTKTTRGKGDLYISHKKENGEWTKPRNLGNKINTKGDEISPFLSLDMKWLYFASDGQAGAISMDIFRVSTEDLTFKNLGEVEPLAELNSDKFDAYYYEKGDKCFYSTNRNSNYSKIVASIPEVDLEPLVEEDTEEYDKKTNFTDDELKTSQEQLDALGNKDLADMDESEADDLLKNLNTIAPTQYIYFDVNTSNIRFDSREVLDVVITVLNKYTSLKVDLSGHSDAIGGYKYNERLSLGRAQSAANFLIKKEIQSNRIKVSAAGSSKPIATNVDEAGRALNRRAQFEFYY